MDSVAKVGRTRKPHPAVIAYLPRILLERAELATLEPWRREPSFRLDYCLAWWEAVSASGVA